MLTWDAGHDVDPQEEDVLHLQAMVDLGDVFIHESLDCFHLGGSNPSKSRVTYSMSL